MYFLAHKTKKRQPRDYSGEGPEPAIEISQILKENLISGQDSEKPLQAQPVGRKKLRDYVIVMIVVNLVMVGLFFIMGSNVISDVFFLFGSIFFSVSFTWMMWRVIADY